MKPGDRVRHLGSGVIYTVVELKRRYRTDGAYLMTHGMKRWMPLSVLQPVVDVELPE